MKTIKQSLLSIVIGLALAAGVSYAASWVGPTANPPAGNTDTPVNVGASTQYKIGALGIGGLFRAYGQTILATTTINGDINIPTGAGNGKVLTSDASGKGSWQVSNGGGGSGGGRQLFLSNGTFTVPQGVNNVVLTMAGGGGGGGSGADILSINGNACGANASGGGAGQIYESYMIQVIPGNSYPITIGKGGVGGTTSASYASGKNGGDSSFGLLKTAKGGSGGITQEFVNCDPSDFSCIGLLENGKSCLFGEGGQAWSGLSYSGFYITAVAPPENASGSCSGGGSGYTSFNIPGSCEGTAIKVGGANGSPGFVLVEW